MATLRIVEYTDPGCPFGFSAEPARHRLRWLYGDEIEWDVRMVGLAESGEEYVERGFTVEAQSETFVQMAGAYGMPIDPGLRERMAATLPACRAVVAARLAYGSTAARTLVRWLSVKHFGGMLLDEPSTIAAAAQSAGLDAGALAARMEDADTERALTGDLAAARAPSPEALAQPERLAGWDGGLRYTCPSYEITRVDDGSRMAAPGFQSLRAYELAIANLAPELARRPDPERAEDVLEAFDTPLATREVAEVMGVDTDTARARLAPVARIERVGADGYWTLATA